MRTYFDTILAGHGAARHLLLGRALRPYCLAHSGALEAVGSPLLTGKPPGPLDILHAARVCACGDFDALARVFDSDPTEPEAAALLRIADSPDALAAASAAWYRYLAETAPAVEMFRPSGARPLASPGALAMVVRASRALRISPDEAWWIPLGRLRLYMATADEFDGHGRPWTPAEIAKRDELRARGILGTAHRGAPTPKILSIRKAKEALLRRRGRV